MLPVQAPSWSSVNYGGRWKLLHYTAKKFFAPLIISADYDAGSNLVAVYLTSDVNQALSGAQSPDRSACVCLLELDCACHASLACCMPSERVLLALFPGTRAPDFPSRCALLCGRL
jgi:hypothetical protein